MSSEIFFSNLEYILFTGDSPVSLFFAFVFGGLCGSFLNVCAYRIPIGRSIVLPASSCFSCGEPVRWYHNVPVLGYLLLGGRCHDCGSPFSWRYAAVELLTACFSCAFFYRHGGFTFPYFYWFAFYCVLTVVFLIDLDHWLILDSVVFPSAAFALIAGLFVEQKADSGLWLSFLLPSLPVNSMIMSAADSVAGGLFGLILFAAISFYGAIVFRREAMGGGDVKFALMIGAFLGLELSVEAFVLSFVIGVVCLVPFMIFRGKSGKDPVPFGTFMAVGAVVALFFGDFIKNCFFALY